MSLLRIIMESWLVSKVWLEVKRGGQGGEVEEV